MKHVIIIGASSGLGYGIARSFAEMGYKTGIAARRETPLKELKESYPQLVSYVNLDITASDAVLKFRELITATGGLDMLVLASGVGKQNPCLDENINTTTTMTNVVGFTRIVDEAYRYFRQADKPGQIAVISSIAGTKGLGIAASYSATKRFQNTYIDAIEQLANMQKTDIAFTDIRPGFISTPLLDDEKKYPMIMSVDYAVPLIVKAILQRKRRAVIDWRWSILVTFWKLIPNWLWKRLPVKNN